MSLADRTTSPIYQRYPPAALLNRPDIESKVIFGMGSGGMGTYLRQVLGDLELDFVEIDPAVARVAKEFFFLEEDARSRIHLPDARQFLRTTDET